MKVLVHLFLWAGVWMWLAVLTACNTVKTTKIYHDPSPEIEAMDPSNTPVFGSNE